MQLTRCSTIGYGQKRAEILAKFGLVPVVRRALQEAEELTRRQQAEEALRRSEERLRAMFDHAGVGIVELAQDGRFIEVNGRACQILGRTREQLLATTVHELTWPEDRPLTERMHRELIAGLRSRIDYEKRYRRGDGTPMWAHVTVSPIRDAGGRWLRSILTMEDITDRKRAEEELADAKQLAECAKAAAELANRAKDHFLAVLSHELRTPLTPVVMGVSMLQERPDLAPQVRDTLEMVQRNVEMEARLIDDLLDVTRIARGKVELRRKPVRLCTILQRAVEVCQPDIDARRLHFDVDLGPAAPYWVEGDAARLQQVFWNLLKNAVKFTPAGGRVGIRCRPVDAGSGCESPGPGAPSAFLLVEVNDSGIGIGPEDLVRVFDAFEQAERSTTRQFGGLGLGLAISKALVELHGGTIDVRSEGRDQGATFRVRLPLIEPDSQAELPLSAVQPRHTARPLHILLVEDHAVTAQMMQLLLAEEGHAVEVAGDTAAALELAGRYAFDLLLSDLGLPDGSGHDLMRELRARGYRFPAIALSGYGQEEDVQLSRQAGFAAHLTKPASRDAVLEAVASVNPSRSAEVP